MKKRKRKNFIKGLWDDLPPLAKFGIVIGVSGVGGFITYKIVKKQIDKGKMRSEIKNFQDKTIEDLDINLLEVSKEIFDALKLGYASYDPRSWKEDEEAASLAVLKVPKPFIKQLELTYNKKYNRNLQNDLQNYLDEYWEKVRYLFM